MKSGSYQGKKKQMARRRSKDNLFESRSEFCKLKTIATHRVYTDKVTCERGSLSHNMDWI